jgi:hypothetical protein
LRRDVESVEYEGPIKGSGGSRDDDSLKDNSKGLSKDLKLGVASNNALDFNRFGKSFASKGASNISFDEKNNFQFPENQAKSQEEESMVRKVKNADFLERFKKFGDAFKPEKPTVASNLPGAKGLEQKGGLLSRFGNWDEEAPQQDNTAKNLEEKIDEAVVQPKQTEIAVTKDEPHASKIAEPVTAEKKKTSEHPMADTIQADLQNILKKSTETSMSKSKLLERKAEIERQLASNLKIGKGSPKLNFHFDDFGTSNQDAHPKPHHVSGQPDSPARRYHTIPDNQPKPSRTSSRASLGLLNFLSQAQQNSETMENAFVNEGPLPESNHMPSNFNEEDQKLSNNSFYEEARPEKTSIEQAEMEVGKRSRKSYFPEKLLKKVKVDPSTEETEQEEEIQALTNRFKGPFFSVLSNNQSNIGLQSLFDGLGLGRDEASTISKSSGILERLTEKKEAIRSLRIESLSDFSMKQNEERRTNLEIIGLDSDKHNFLESNFEKRPFEKVIKDILMQKLGFCFDMASRLTLLTEINNELDEKLKLASEIKKEIDDIEVPKAEDMNGEWTEQRLFCKIAKEYGFQYFKYSLQRETGQIDVTFALDDILFFSLHFEKLPQSDSESYYLQTGTCKHSPIVVPPLNKTANPLNKPEYLSTIYGRIIATSSNDSEPSDALNFLVYLGCEQRRLNIIKRSLNLSVAKHKISDIVIDMPSYVIHFLMFPKIAKVNFSLKVSTSLLVSEHANVVVEILSSQHKKKNIKSEVFSDLDEEIKSLLAKSSAVGQDWLIDLIDELGQIINKDSKD